jgi:arginyl-tRNA synthetase
MKIYSGLLIEITKLLKKYSINESVEMRISKFKNYDYQINLFVRYSSHKEIKKIIEEIASILNSSELIESFEITDNFFINLRVEARNITTKLIDVEKNIKTDTPKDMIIDYGGPNIGKPLHVGHLRPLNIGRSIYSMNRIVENNILSDIHLGDWGMPVAQIITYCDDENIEIEKLTIEMLEEIYPLASSKYKSDKVFRTNALKTNKQLSTKHLNIISKWKSLRGLTLTTLKDTLTLLDHDFDYWWGESTVNDLIPKMLEELFDNNKIQKDDGAFISSQITDPRILIVKSDGSYLYITTDLATVILRNKKIPHEKVLYVTDNRQKLHFEQLFQSIKYFEFPTKEYNHIGFGTINDSNGNPLKTRDGGNLKLTDLYTQTFEYIQKINNTLSDEDINCLTNTVLTYSDLITNRKTDYKFDLEKFTSVSGKTGIYIQYAQVRAKRIIEAVGIEIMGSKIDVPTHLDDIERNLIMNLANIEFFLEMSIKNSEPHHLANYLYEISNLFNTFYQESNIKNMENEDKKRTKIFITNLFIQYSHLVMGCLGIKPVEKM